MKNDHKVTRTKDSISIEGFPQKENIKDSLEESPTELERLQDAVDTVEALKWEIRKKQLSNYWKLHKQLTGEEMTFELRNMQIAENIGAEPRENPLPNWMR